MDVQTGLRPWSEGRSINYSAFERDLCEGGRSVLSAKVLASLASGPFFSLCVHHKNSHNTPWETRRKKRNTGSLEATKANGFPTLAMMALCRPNVTLQCIHVIHVRKMKLTYHLLSLSLSLHTFVLRYASKGFCLITLTWSKDLLPSATPQTRNFSHRRDEQFCPRSHSQMGQNPNSPSAAGQVTDTGLKGMRWRHPLSPEANEAHQSPVG